MSRLEIDSWKKGARLRSVGEAVAEFVGCELGEDTVREKFSQGVIDVINATNRTLRVRGITLAAADIAFGYLTPSESGGYRPAWYSLDEMAAKADNLLVEITNPDDMYARLLTDKPKRVTRLFTNLTDFVRAEAVEDTADLIFAPDEVFAYYNQQWEDNNSRVKYSAKELLGTVAICSFARQVDFRPIIAEFTV